MYRNCIFCASDLGANESIETFPVGKRLAFDPWKARLWVVCPVCARWNLTAVEERWEAVEDAERLFRDSSLRVQSENVGLAKLPDGTMLIRVGDALEGEMAAWRYGGQLLNRRKRYLVTTAVGVGAGVAVVGGVSAMGMTGGTYLVWKAIHRAWEKRQGQKVVHRLPAFNPATGDDLLVRRWHIRHAHLKEGPRGEIALEIPSPKLIEPPARPKKRKPEIELTVPSLLVMGSDAHALLSRSMVHVNNAGASKKLIGSAVQVLSEAGSAESFLTQAARKEWGLGTAKDADLTNPALSQEGRLALEMALHEESERRAMDGELALLTAAWKEAEEIAAIADLLPFDPLDRLMKVFT